MSVDGFILALFLVAILGPGLASVLRDASRGSRHERREQRREAIRHYAASGYEARDAAARRSPLLIGPDPATEPLARHATRTLPVYRGEPL